MKKPIKFFVFIILCMVLYFLRAPILRTIPHWLIKEDKLEKADALIVLSGNSFDRGNKAVQLYNRGLAPIVICPGGNPAYEFEILDMHITEAEAAKINLVRQGIPANAIVLLNAGTSTAEEAALIADYLKNKNYRKVILLTSLYHTRRAKKVFSKYLQNSNIKLMVCGAKSSRFDVWNWWKTEDGLIAMNNELLKNIYYMFK